MAVGYSLGLAALGAVARRSRRPLRPQDDVHPRRLAVDPCVHRCGVGRVRSRSSSGPASSAASSARHGLPDDARSDRCALVRSGAARSRSPCGPPSAVRSLRSGRSSRAHSSQHFWWGSVFLVTLPLAAVALALAVLFVPSHVNETTEPVDNLGGVLSALIVGALDPRPSTSRRCRTRRRSSSGFRPWSIAAGDRLRSSGDKPRRRSRCTTSTSRRVGDLLGRSVRGHHRLRLADGRDVRRQQYLQNVLQLLEPRGRGLAIIPAAVFMVLIAPRSASSSRRRAPESRCSSDMCSASSGSSPCCCSGATTARTGRWRSAMRSSALGSASRARLRRTR